MQQEIGQEQIRAKIAELRNRYARLWNLCGPKGISKATTENYAREIDALEARLK